MKSLLRGRELSVRLVDDVKIVATELQERGYPPDRADSVAAAAVRFAADETEQLTRCLTPRELWPGTVAIRRVAVGRNECSHLMIKYQAKSGWSLDSAFFD